MFTWIFLEQHCQSLKTVTVNDIGSEMKWNECFDGVLVRFHPLNPAESNTLNLHIKNQTVLLLENKKKNEHLEEVKHLIVIKGKVENSQV